MASEVKTNKVSPATGTTLSVGDSGDTLALATDAVTGFQVGSDAAGDVLYHDGTDYTRLAKPGTPAGEVLTFATSATTPSWVAVAAQDNTPSFCAYNSSTQNLTSAGFTLIAANTEVYDTDSGYDTGTYTYTVPTAGKYFVFCGGRVIHTSAASILKFGLAIYKDGTKDDGLYTLNYLDAGGVMHRDWESYSSTVLDLGVDDELKWYIFSQESTGGGQYTQLQNNQYQNSWGAFKLAGV